LPKKISPACRFRSRSIVASCEGRSRSIKVDRESGQRTITRWEYKAMRVLVFIKANEESEAGVMPDEKFVGEMMKYNEELVKAGILLGAEGLLPSSKGARVHFSGDKVKVIDGPFAETKELIAGFWIWRVNSLDEAIAWVKRCPKPEGATEGTIEIRPIFDPEEFCATLPPEMKAQDERMRAEIAKQKSS
jgi:hypothetical protein